MIQLVLLDIDMPRMDGFKTFHALRRIDPSAMVLLISGQIGARDVRTLLAAGARGFLQKPYDVTALDRAISQSLLGPD